MSSPNTSTPKKFRDHLTEEEAAAAEEEEEEKKERSREEFSQVRQVTNSSNKAKWGELLVLLLVMSTLKFSVLGIENLKLGAS